MSKRGIHSLRSTNCICDVPVSKCSQSGSVTARPAIAPARAIQRAAAASRSRPTASTARPATIGTQMDRDRYGIIAASPRPVREQCEYAEDHRERVVIDVAGLHVPPERSRPADEASRAIDEEAVDDGAVADGGQEVTHRARAAGEEPVVEPVEIVFLVEQRVDRAGRALE